jgi:hypothetical protein
MRQYDVVWINIMSETSRRGMGPYNATLAVIILIRIQNHRPMSTLP